MFTKNQIYIGVGVIATTAIAVAVWAYSRKEATVEAIPDAVIKPNVKPVAPVTIDVPVAPADAMFKTTLTFVMDPAVSVLHSSGEVISAISIKGESALDILSSAKEYIQSLQSFSGDEVAILAAKSALDATLLEINLLLAAAASDTKLTIHHEHNSIVMGRMIPA